MRVSAVSNCYSCAPRRVHQNLKNQLPPQPENTEVAFKGPGQYVGAAGFAALGALVLGPVGALVGALVGGVAGDVADAADKSSADDPYAYHPSDDLQYTNY